MKSRPLTNAWRETCKHKATAMWISARQTKSLTHLILSLSCCRTHMDGICLILPHWASKHEIIKAFNRIISSVRILICSVIYAVSGDAVTDVQNLSRNPIKWNQDGRPERFVADLVSFVIGVANLISSQDGFKSCWMQFCLFPRILAISAQRHDFV